MRIDGVEFSELDIGRFLWLRVNHIGARVVRLASLEPKLIVEGMDGKVIEAAPEDLSIGQITPSLKRTPGKTRFKEA